MARVLASHHRRGPLRLSFSSTELLVVRVKPDLPRLLGDSLGLVLGLGLGGNLAVTGHPHTNPAATILSIIVLQSFVARRLRIELDVSIAFGIAVIIERHDQSDNVAALSEVFSELLCRS